MRLLHPGFVTTITAWLRDHPDPTEEQARQAIGGNLCRCTGYQNIVASVLRAAELLRDQEGGAVTTRTMGEPIARREDPRLVSGEGRYLDDLGGGALAAAFVRSPTRPPGSSTSTSARPSGSTGWSPSTPTRTSRGPWPSPCRC